MAICSSVVPYLAMCFWAARAKHGGAVSPYEASHSRSTPVPMLRIASSALGWVRFSTPRPTSPPPAPTSAPPLMVAPSPSPPPLPLPSPPSGGEDEGEGASILSKPQRPDFGAEALHVPELVVFVAADQIGQIRELDRARVSPVGAM